MKGDETVRIDGKRVRSLLCEVETGGDRYGDDVDAKVPTGVGDESGKDLGVVAAKRLHQDADAGSRMKTKTKSGEETRLLAGEIQEVGTDDDIEDGVRGEGWGETRGWGSVGGFGERAAGVAPVTNASGIGSGDTRVEKFRVFFPEVTT